MEASSYRLLDAAILTRSTDFYSTAGSHQKRTAHSWRVSGGLSALPHEPAQTTDAPEKPNRSKPQKRNERKLSNEKDEKSMCSVTRSVVRFPAYLSVRPGQLRPAGRARRPTPPPPPRPAAPPAPRPTPRRR